MHIIFSDANGIKKHVCSPHDRTEAQILDMIGVEVPQDWTFVSTNVADYQPQRSIRDVINMIWKENHNKLIEGIYFDGYRHGGDGGHREYIMSQYTLIKSGSSSQYGSSLRDSDGNDQTMDDAKLCDLYEKGADYVSKINQAAMAAEDSLHSMTQEQLNSFDPEADIVWPSNIYTYP